MPLFNNQKLSAYPPLCSKEKWDHLRIIFVKHQLRKEQHY
nr:MAG TPA: DNA repair protein [Caudoviricetes sp.]